MRFIVGVRPSGVWLLWTLTFLTAVKLGPNYNPNDPPPSPTPARKVIKPRLVKTQGQKGV